ncbi:hypothetical protein [Nocardioides sp. SYSU DS0663]|uniref:hypothetical protein n=1 Tax=Nocardioides sp. SYSU DS0663 TaxID=3416445 RepID=UPI003F4B4A81
MNSMTTNQMALCPSGFALPARGHASATAASSAVVTVAVTGSLSAAATAAAWTKGDLRLVPARIRGTSAWRPPIC